MLDETTTDTTPGNEIAASGPPDAGAAAPVTEEAPPARAPRKRAPRKTAAKKAAATTPD